MSDPLRVTLEEGEMGWIVTEGPPITGKRSAFSSSDEALAKVAQLLGVDFRAHETVRAHESEAPPQPEPKAGQVWRDSYGHHILTHRVAGEVWGAVRLWDGSWSSQNPVVAGWTYVCDGAVPASEVRDV